MHSKKIPYSLLQSMSLTLWNHLTQNDHFRPVDRKMTSYGNHDSGQNIHFELKLSQLSSILPNWNFKTHLETQFSKKILIFFLVKNLRSERILSKIYFMKHQIENFALLIHSFIHSFINSLLGCHHNSNGNYPYPGQVQNNKKKDRKVQ